jgi:hypothetical protein
MKKLGIIQTRGLGDIVLALPIAKHFHDQGYHVHWPISDIWVKQFQKSSPWVKWIPVPVDTGPFFYEIPMERLKNVGCEEIICLYQSLSSNPEFSNAPWFQIQKFDEYKYTRAGVPFHKKWTLEKCITRDPTAEQALYNRTVKNSNYYVTHLEGSNYKTSPNLSSLPSDWQRIDIREGITDSIFDWLTVIERAQALICLDSVIANMVDQLDISVDKYWIPRSHIQLTPVLGSNWTILDPPPDSLAAQKIFMSSK